MTFLHDVNPRQQEAIKAVQGPVMVVAGPGSGKTRVLTYRIAYLISIGVPAYQMLALTFTNKAANEMKERISALVGEKSRSLWMGTFHSIFARILRSECEKIGFRKNFSIYDTADSLHVIKGVMARSGISTQQFAPQAIRSRISSAKNALVHPEDYAQRATDLFEEKTALVYREYQKQLLQNNAMDFDDLLLKPIDLFSRHAKVLASYQDRFRFILIDEYQDTNHAQYTLIRHLAEKYRNLCVVGDDAQSIYAFRGADIRNILDFKRDYPEAVTVRLEQNYRSTRTILRAADQVIKHNVDQLTKDLWTENGEGEPITVLVAGDDREEGASIVERIFDDCHRGKLDLKDFAVMYRTNAQSRSIEDAFRRNNIRYTIVGNIEFYQRKEVKDVLAYLRILVNPADNENMERVVNYPNRGIGDVAMSRLKRFAEEHGINLLDAAAQAGTIPGLTPRAAKALLEFHSLVDKYRRLMGEMSISELSRAYVDEIGILRLFKEEGTPESMSRWENVQEVLSAISEFSATTPDATLEQFLQDIALMTSTDEWDDTHNAVTLMTLHSAKGLEFPVVFVAGLEEGLLPFYTGSLDRKELEEERRLFYVGMTRAMRKLYLSYARVRFKFGEIAYQSASRFIEEIDSGLMEVRSPHAPLHSQRRPASRTHATAGEPRRQPRIDPDRHHYIDGEADYNSESVSADALRVGGLVEHESFGRGKVVNVLGSGDNVKAVVDFPSAGRKNLLLKYARLKIL